MPVNSRGQRVKKHDASKQRAQASALRKPKKSVGSGVIGGAANG
jgi:hypothetical protein